MAMVVALCFSPLSRAGSKAQLSRYTDSLTSLISEPLTRPLNILILGIDNSGHPHADHVTPAEALSGNSDTLLLVRLDPSQHQVTILSIPRDSRVQIPGIGLDKINSANVKGGATLAAQTVSQLLGNMAIDRYIRVDTEGFVRLVDAIDGLEVTVPKPMNYIDQTQHLTIHLAPGKQTLSGQHLQEYVRYRHDNLGDIGRVQRQQEVVKLILQKLVQPKMLAKLPQLVHVVQENVDSNLSLGDLLAISKNLTSLDRQHLNLVMLPGRFSRADEFPLSYWITDPQMTADVLARYFEVSPPD